MTIQKVIEKGGKSQNEVAKHLGISWRNLYYRMQDPRRFKGTEVLKLIEILPDVINVFSKLKNKK